MAWPTDDLNTNDFDDGVNDSPALARVMLKRLIERTKTLIAARGIANGIASLGADGRVPQAQLPPSSGGGMSLWAPAGTYLQGVAGTTLLQLLAQATPYRRLRIAIDYQYGGIASAANMDETFAAVPAHGYGGYDTDVWVYRAALGATGFFNALDEGGIQQRAGHISGHVALGLQLTSPSTVTVKITLARNRGDLVPGLRLYGIYGYTT